MSSTSVGRDNRTRFLVLTSSTGGGHDARAGAFREWMELLFGDQVEVRVEQMLEKSSGIGRTGVDAYNWIQRRAPWLHIPFYALVEGLSLLNRSSVSFGRAYYAGVLDSFRPHLILSVHDCLNRGFFQLAKARLGDSVRCATYTGEFSGGWGFSINWVEPSADLFIARTDEAARFAVQLGMPPERTVTRGHFLAPREDLETLSPDLRIRYRHRLGLDTDRTTLLMATGGTGANNHRALFDTLASLAGSLQVIFMCGRDADTRAWLDTRIASQTALRACTVGYTDEVHLLIQASDLIFTRGGTTTCAKALHFRCPILFNCFGGTMPQERLTLRFFMRGGTCPSIGNEADFAHVLRPLATSADRLAAFRADFEHLRYQSETHSLVTELANLGAAASGGKLRPRTDWRARVATTEAYRALAAHRAAPESAESGRPG
jgi:processive 1,2-diacylglycerol beta-glucosyltransferase